MEENKMRLKDMISPVVVSTILGHAGRGMFPLTLNLGYRRFVELVKNTGTTSLTKSSTRHKRIGNFIPYNPLTWKYVQKLSDLGLLNAFGLTNSGAWVCAEKMAIAYQKGFKLIPNVYPEFDKGTTMAIQETICTITLFEDLLKENFKAVEISYSCPNSKEDITQNMKDGIECTEAVKKRFPNLKVIAKISYVHPYEFAQELVRVGADAIHAINSIPYNSVYSAIDDISPLNDVGGGGVSGGPITDLSLEYNKELRKAVDCFLIMGGGIVCLADAKRFLNVGADALSICTIVRRDVAEASKIVMVYNNIELGGDK